MRRSHRARPAALLGAAALVAATTGVFISTAAPANAATSPWSGSADADLVHLNAVNFPGAVNVADATVAPATSKASTTTSPRVTSDATNANLQLLSKAVNQNLLVEAKQTAPPDNATAAHDELLSVPAAPVLTASVATADAHSRWKADDSCFTSGPVSTSISKLADAVVLPGSPAGDAVALTNKSDPSGASVSTTTLGLVKQPASAANYAVRSTSSTQITSVSLLGGALVVDVLTAPKVVATATGVPGTSTVVLTQPVLRVNGQTLLAGESLSPLNIPGAPLVTLTAGTLTKSISPDGRTASGHGNLLTLKVLSGAPSPLTLLDLSVADVTATATAPSGGVSCETATPDPLRDARKDASALTVNAGHTFNYVITVPNRGNADLDDVKVTDTVSGSPALELVSSSPAATSHSGNTYTFSLGTIAPNQVKTITMTFRVPSSADIGTDYSNKAVITATYAGQHISKTVSTPNPSVDGPGSGPCDLSQSTKFASHIKVTPGERFTYYVNVFNQGGSACTSVVVRDALTKGVRFVSCTYSCTHSGQLVTWRISRINPSDSLTLAVTVKTVATSGRLPNDADITPSSGTGGTPHTPGPQVTNVSVLSPSYPAARGNQNLARTGVNPAVATLSVLVLGAGLLLRRKAVSGL